MILIFSVIFSRSGIDLSSFSSQSTAQVGSNNVPTLISSAVVGSQYLLVAATSNWASSGSTSGDYSSQLAALILGATVNDRVGVQGGAVILCITATATTIQCNKNTGLNTNSFYYKYMRL